MVVFSFIFNYAYWTSGGCLCMVDIYDKKVS